MDSSDIDRKIPAQAGQPSSVPQLAQEVVDFWLDSGPQKWFSKNADFDAAFRSRFYDAHMTAAGRKLEPWLQHHVSALALILLLDQFPRNGFRNTAHMFATDGLALSYARKSLHHLDKTMPELRNFICLPFMHAEDLAVQEESIVLYRQHVPESMKWAVEHRDIIARFGRFPHRNQVLGRASTDAELEFLAAGGFAG